jgi:hypothetical protein
MKATKSSLVNVLEDAGLYMTGLHEPERRRLMFILNIPLPSVEDLYKIYIQTGGKVEVKSRRKAVNYIID